MTLEVVMVTRSIHLMVFGAGDCGPGFCGWCWVHGDCIVRDWYLGEEVWLDQCSDNKTSKC